MELSSILGIITSVLGAIVTVAVTWLYSLNRHKINIKPINIKKIKISSRPDIFGIFRRQNNEPYIYRPEAVLKPQGLELKTDIVQELEKRLSSLETTLATFYQRKPELNSQEYQLLVFEFNRVTSDLKTYYDDKQNQLLEQQKKYEIELERRLDTFQTIFYVSLTIVGLIVTGFGVVVFFIGKGG